MEHGQYKSYIMDNEVQGRAANERDNFPHGSSERRECNLIVHANDKENQSNNPYAGDKDMTEAARAYIDGINNKK